MSTHNPILVAERASGVPHFESKWEIEQHLAARHVPTTVLRPVYFMENLLSWQAPEENGELVVRWQLGPDTRFR